MTHLQTMQQTRTVLAALLARRVRNVNIDNFVGLQLGDIMQICATPYIMSDQIQFVAIIRHSNCCKYKNKLYISIKFEYLDIYCIYMYTSVNITFHFYITKKTLE